MISDTRIFEIYEEQDRPSTFARAIEAEVAAPLEATIAQQAERIKELIAIDKERAAQLFEGMGKTLALEKQLAAANALIAQLHRIAKETLTARYMVLFPFATYTAQEKVSAEQAASRETAKKFLTAIKQHQQGAQP